ncbi:hypothetical protein [Streptomyces sp. NPDC057496]|uniref:hypothetical protein n=1 Tax=Streptomyces sp. NPDC057496 TaxID=3346149 RepID=UPI00367B42F1
MSDSQVTIKPANDEAPVLSHWLEKFRMTGLSRVVDDPVVRAPIHQIAGTLDKALPGLFTSDHDQHGPLLGPEFREQLAEHCLRISRPPVTWLPDCRIFTGR